MSPACFVLPPGGGHLQLPGNPSDEHLPGAPGNRPGLGPPLFRPDASSLTNSRARAGRHRHGQDHLLVPVADPGPAGSHGRPHQLRALSGLQQLHLRVSSPTRARAGWVGGWSLGAGGQTCVGRLQDDGACRRGDCGIFSMKSVTQDEATAHLNAGRGERRFGDDWLMPPHPNTQSRGS